jgi:hypothetical protein
MMIFDDSIEYPPVFIETFDLPSPPSVAFHHLGSLIVVLEFVTELVVALALVETL